MKPKDFILIHPILGKQRLGNISSANKSRIIIQLIQENQLLRKKLNEKP